MSDETWNGYRRFQREHAEAQTDQAWERCAAVTMPLGHIVAATVVDQVRFGVFLDLDAPFIGLLELLSYPPEFDARADEHPPIGSTIRVIVVSHADKQIRVSARPEVIDSAGRLSILTSFALVDAHNGREFAAFAAYEKRDWLPGDVFPWSVPLRVVRVIEPERDDQLTVLAVEPVASSA